MRQLYYEDMANWIFKCQFTTLIDCDSITRQNSKKISYIDLQFEKPICDAKQCRIYFRENMLLF